MNASARLKIDKAGFFAFLASRSQGRYEYVEGRIVQQMTGGTLAHTLIAERIRDHLLRQLDRSIWLVTSQGRGVETATTIRYPDVVVESAGADIASLSTREAVIVVEVLSPSTEETDLNVKPPEYMSLASLSAYVVASQSAAECWVWQRSAAGAFPVEPEHVRGRGKVVTIANLNASLALSEIYQGIE